MGDQETGAAYLQMSAMIPCCLAATSLRAFCTAFITPSCDCDSPTRPSSFRPSKTARTYSKGLSVVYTMYIHHHIHKGSRSSKTLLNKRPQNDKLWRTILR